MTEATAPKKPRKPRKPKTDVAATADAPAAQPSAPEGLSLLDAVKFVSAAQHDTGPVYARHVVLWDGRIYAFDGIIGMSAPVAEHLGVAAHTATLLAALQRAKGGPLALTVQAPDLIVSAGRLRVTVPCVELRDMPPVDPDPCTVPLTEDFRRALALVAPAASETATRVALACIAVRTGSVIATDGSIVIEAWHGLEVPPLLLPKASAVALLKISKQLVGLGHSAGRCTFYFADGSWMRTQLHVDTYPDIDRVLNATSNPEPVPADLFDAVRAMAPFVGEMGGLLLSPFGVSVALVPEDSVRGASYEMQGVPVNTTVNVKYLLMIAEYARMIDFGAARVNSGGLPNLAFFGDNIRGLIAPMRNKSAE